MNLQEALNYRPSCFIHQQPMRLYVRPEIRTYDILYQQTENGISLWRKGNKPLAGAQINFDGTFAINKNQPNLRRFLASSSRMGMMCRQCRSVDHIHKNMEWGSLNPFNASSPCHFYTFFLFFSEAGNYQCGWGIEMILYYQQGKLYHLTGSIGGGAAHFHMGNCHKKMLIGRIADGLFSLKVPNFDPAKILTLEQMVEKIELYSLFS